MILQRCLIAALLWWGCGNTLAAQTTPIESNQYYAPDGSTVQSAQIMGLDASCHAVPSGTVTPVTATIANGQSLSGAVDLCGLRAFAIVVPSVWTGTTTSITFQSSADGTTYGELYNDAGTEVTVTVTGVSTYIVFASPVTWLGVRYLKVRSGTAAAAVSQGQSTVLTIIAIP